MVQTEETAKAGEEKQGVSAPAITLPKGGGAIHGMGEKFAANPVTGTGSMSHPDCNISRSLWFWTSQLSLSYDSGAGNGPFRLRLESYRFPPSLGKPTKACLNIWIAKNRMFFYFPGQKTWFRF